MLLLTTRHHDCPLLPVQVPSVAVLSCVDGASAELFKKLALHGLPEWLSIRRSAYPVLICLLQEWFSKSSCNTHNSTWLAGLYNGLKQPGFCSSTRSCDVFCCINQPISSMPHHELTALPQQQFALILLEFITPRAHWCSLAQTGMPHACTVAPAAAAAADLPPCTCVAPTVLVSRHVCKVAAGAGRSLAGQRGAAGEGQQPQNPRPT
jgi:hypothetical protein